MSDFAQLYFLGAIGMFFLLLLVSFAKGMDGDPISHFGVCVGMALIWPYTLYEIAMKCIHGV